MKNDKITEGQIIGFGRPILETPEAVIFIWKSDTKVFVFTQNMFLIFDGSETIVGKELWVTNGWKSPRLHSSYRKSKVKGLSTEEEAITFQKNEPKYQ